MSTTKKETAPLRRHIGQKIGELFDLRSNGVQVHFGREEVRHLEEEQSGECRCDKAVVHGIPERSTGEQS